MGGGKSLYIRLSRIEMHNMNAAFHACFTARESYAATGHDHFIRIASQLKTRDIFIRTTI
jgi:hypothetical protein